MTDPNGMTVNGIQPPTAEQIARQEHRHPMFPRTDPERGIKNMEATAVARRASKKRDIISKKRDALMAEVDQMFHWHGPHLEQH